MRVRYRDRNTNIYRESFETDNKYRERERENKREREREREGLLSFLYIALKFAKQHKQTTIQQE